MFTADELERVIRQADAQHASDMEALRQAAEVMRRRGLAPHVLSGTPTQKQEAPAASRTTVAKNHVVQIVAKKNGAAAGNKPTGMAEYVREVYTGLFGEFSIRTIAAEIERKRPDLARTNNFMIAISSVLLRDSKPGGSIRLLSKGTAGKPSTYLNNRTGEERFLSNAANEQKERSASGPLFE